jgi:hypothetical protein
MMGIKKFMCLLFICTQDLSDTERDGIGKEKKGRRMWMHPGNSGTYNRKNKNKKRARLMRS